MRIRVWDIPTRLFHWLLVSVFFSALLFSWRDSDLDYHIMAGYLLLGLIIFRFSWGFAGPRYSRFSDFVKGWSAVRSFVLKALRREPIRYMGHNPAVGWFVIALLTVLTLTALTGIIIYAGEEGRGAFAGFISYGMAEFARPAHTYIAYFAVFLVTGHILAALFHDFILKERIIVSMITGYKEDEGNYREAEEDRASAALKGPPAARIFTLVLVIIMGLLAIIYLPAEGSKPYRSPQVLGEDGKPGVVIENELWKDECAASCHGAFYPTLLPARSWERIMAGLEEHFEDDASLEVEEVAEIREFLLRTSAERSGSEASRKILASLKAGEEPLRITKTSYWVKKHSSISEEVFNRESIVSRSNCLACHPGADAGSFEDADISVPR